jgi:hypothetical protein
MKFTKSEIIYIVSEAADRALRKQAEVEGFVVDNEELYSAEAQAYYDAYYDAYSSYVQERRSKYSLLNVEALLEDLMALEVKTIHLKK